MKYVYLINKGRVKRAPLDTTKQKRASKKLVESYVKQYGSLPKAIAKLIKEGYNVIPTEIGLVKLMNVIHNNKSLYVPVVLFNDVIIKAVASLQFNVKVKGGS